MVRQDIRRMASWGFELIKHDYTSFDLLGRWGFNMAADLTDAGWHFADRSMTTAEVALALYRTIRDAAGSALILGLQHLRPPGRRTFRAAAYRRRHQRPRIPPHPAHGRQYIGVPRASASGVFRSGCRLRAHHAAGSVGLDLPVAGPGSAQRNRPVRIRPIPKR